jgi:hypothetical protein
MNTRTQNIINLALNSAIIIGSIGISAQTYSVAPQFDSFSALTTVVVSVGLGVGVKVFRAYPYYLSTLPSPAPAAWKWLVIGLALEGFDLAVLGHLLKLSLSIDSALSAIVMLWGYSGSWGMVAMMHDLGLRPIVRSAKAQWLAKEPPEIITTPTPTPVRNLAMPVEYSRSINVAAMSTGMVEARSVSADVTRSTPANQSVLSLLTKTPVSTLLIAQPGSGKTMTASSMGRQWVRDGHHVFYIDGKADPKELSLWDDACSERYQFDGTLLIDPNQECERLLEAFEAFEDFRLRHLGDGKQTICILDELPAVMAVFKTYKPNPNAVLNFVNRIVNRLPSRNCHILAVTQNPSCADTLPTGTLGTLKKIIIAKAGSEAELEEWKGLTVMKPIDLSGVSSAIRNSPVDRACYYSVVQKWLPMESLIREGDYNRDTLSGGDARRKPLESAPIQYQFTDSADSADSADSESIQFNRFNSVDSALTAGGAIKEYFSAVKFQQPKTFREIAASSRIKGTGASADELQDSLDRLVSEGQLIRTNDGYLRPDWPEHN